MNAATDAIFGFRFHIIAGRGYEPEEGTLEDARHYARVYESAVDLVNDSGVIVCTIKPH